MIYINLNIRIFFSVLKFFLFQWKKKWSIYYKADAVDYVKATHKLGEIEKLFNVPQEIYDSEYGEVGATSLKILRCWIA